MAKIIFDSKTDWNFFQAKQKFEEKKHRNAMERNFDLSIAVGGFVCFKNFYLSQWKFNTRNAYGFVNGSHFPAITKRQHLVATNLFFVRKTK